MTVLLLILLFASPISSFLMFYKLHKLENTINMIHDNTLTTANVLSDIKSNITKILSCVKVDKMSSVSFNVD